MEKRTLGSFVAALRKANGMTQRDLAERLHVSDKTISRWERGDGEPELAVIPVLAEIFGVTCDELLRGERRPPEQREPEEAPAVYSEKGEKERRRLLRRTEFRFRTQTWIGVALLALGLIGAALVNLAFTKGLVGFCIAAVFLVAALVCQLIFANAAFDAVLDGDLPEAEEARFRRKVVRTTAGLLAADAGLLGFCLPLALFPGSYGLAAEDWLAYGLLFGAASLLLFGVAYYFVNASLLRRGVYGLPEAEASVYWKNHGYKRGIALFLVPALLITGFVHILLTADPHSLAEGTVFQDYESFVAFMEQDVPYDGYAATHTPTQEEAPVAPPDVEYFDAEGLPIPSEEANRREMTNIHGQIVCTYVKRNWSVLSIHYRQNEDGSILPIRVLTREDYRLAEQRAANYHLLFVALYPAELLIAVVVYVFLRKKPQEG